MKFRLLEAIRVIACATAALLAIDSGQARAQAPETVPFSIYRDRQDLTAPAGLGSSHNMFVFHENGTFTQLARQSGSAGFFQYYDDLLLKGTYAYQKASPATASLTLSDESGTPRRRYELEFATPSSGHVTETVLGDREFLWGSGQFTLHPFSEHNRLLNVSNRAYTSKEHVAITGFIISGTEWRTVVIRGIGPSLPADLIPSRITDPVLTVYDVNGAVVATNNNWAGDAPIFLLQPGPESLSRIFEVIGAPQLDRASKDAVILRDLRPGAYTVHVAAQDGSDGEVLTEVFMLP